MAAATSLLRLLAMMADYRGPLSLLAMMAGYILIAYQRTADQYRRDWCGWRRLLLPVVSERIVVLALMALVYWKLAELAELGLPERYAFLFYIIIGFASEFAGEWLVGHKASRKRRGSSRRSELVTPVQLCIRKKKQDVVDQLMRDPQPTERLRDIIRHSDLSAKSRSALYTKEGA